MAKIATVDPYHLQRRLKHETFKMEGSRVREGAKDQDASTEGVCSCQH